MLAFCSFRISLWKNRQAVFQHTLKGGWLSLPAVRLLSGGARSGAFPGKQDVTDPRARSNARSRSLSHAPTLPWLGDSRTLLRAAAGPVCQPPCRPDTPSPACCHRTPTAPPPACSGGGKAAFIYTGSSSAALPTSHPRPDPAAGDSLNPASSQPVHTRRRSDLGLCAALNHSSRASPGQGKLNRSKALDVTLIRALPN